MQRLHPFVTFALAALLAACGGKETGPKKIQPCGNGALDEGETCDPNIAAGLPGACPELAECNVPNDTCSTAELQGVPEACNVECVIVERPCGDADNCCPSMCTVDEDPDCSDIPTNIVDEECGNGVVDFGENCDPEIPEGAPGSCFCEAPTDACETVTNVGDSSRCILTCVTETVSQCTGGDGCCPSNCNVLNDSDCPEMCGDGVVTGSEICDGDCPQSCDDNDACTTDTLSGDDSTCDAVCEFTDITACIDNDGCCAPGCDPSNDNDCSGSFCGDGNVDPNETCDGNCPTTCDDNDACTTDTLYGDASTCDVMCTNDAIIVCFDNDGCCAPGCTFANDNDCSNTCGNGIIDPNETCDGNCPTAVADCNDFDSCTTDVLSGSAASCNAMCTNNSITQCIGGDGCCAPGCNETNDSDCTAMCGNNVVESGETCDGNCPASCDDGDACTTDVQSGSAATCDLTCASSDITQCIDGDGCCAPGCVFADDDDCPCIPDTCAALALECGTLDDGCGGTEDCGTCALVSDSCVANLCVDTFDVGDACTADADCDGGLGICITQVETGWTSGYCSKTCASDADCGPANHCGADGLCLQNCTDNTDCRADYGCYDTDADLVDECGPLGSGAGTVDAPCTSFADCGGGEAGFCATQRSGFLNGWCSQDCLDDNDCPTNTHCTTDGFCALTCVDNADCRGNGYECFDTDADARTECFRFANGAGGVGEACTGLWDCDGGQFGSCLLDVDGWPSGYCTIECGANEGTCPNGTSCFADTQATYCVDNCQNANQCRTSYQCADPGTGSNACIP